MLELLMKTWKTVVTGVGAKEESANQAAKPKQTLSPIKTLIIYCHNVLICQDVLAW